MDSSGTWLWVPYPLIHVLYLTLCLNGTTGKWYPFKPVIYTHTYTRLTAPFPGISGWASTRKVKPIRILLKQETVSGSGISWAICKSAPRSIQTTTPAPHCSVFLQAGCPSCHPTYSVKALKMVIHLSSIHLERFDCSRFPLNLMQYCKYSEADTYDTLPPCCCLLSESSSFDTYLTSLPLYVYNIGAQSKPCTCTHTTLCLNQIMTAAAATTTTTPI